MEPLHNLSTQTQRSRSRLSNNGVSGPLPSPLPLLPTSRDETNPRFLNPQQVPMISQPRVHGTSSNGIVGHMLSSPPGYSTDIHFSSMSPDEIQLRNAKFFPHSPATAAVLPLNDSWCLDSLTDFSDLPVNGPLYDRQVENSIRSVASEECKKKSDWQALHDQLIAGDDSVDPNWSDILCDDRFTDPEPIEKITCQISTPSLNSPPQNLSVHPPASSGICTAVTPSPSLSSTAMAKQRMRWTNKLHNAFVMAVSHLGGCEKATPKAVLKCMNVEGVTIYHVKSHLQKYRTSGIRLDSLEGSSEKKQLTIEELSSLDLTTGGKVLSEAMKLQVIVHKQLLEQIEVQRNLQARLDEQSKCLREMIEQQQSKLGFGFDKENDVVLETPAPFSCAIQYSTVMEELKSLQVQMQYDPDKANSALEKSILELDTHIGQNSPETDKESKTKFSEFFDSLPSKRRRIEEQSL